MLQIAAQPVDAALHSGPAQQPGKLRMGRVRLVDEQVRSGFRPRGEDLRPQDGRMQGGALPAHRRTEERRDQVVECAGHLGLDDAPGDLEVRLVPAQDFRRVLAAVDDLHVVGRDHRQAVVHREEVAPALEVGDDHLRAEALRHVEVGADVARPAAGHRAAQVGEEGAEAAHLVVLGDDGEAPDLLDVQVLAGALRQVVVRAPGDDHLHVVPLDQLVEHHPRADGVAHALADDAVEDAHAPVVTR